MKPAPNRYSDAHPIPVDWNGAPLTVGGISGHHIWLRFCQDCGGAVFYHDIHDDWHRKHGEDNAEEGEGEKWTTTRRSGD